MDIILIEAVQVEENLAEMLMFMVSHMVTEVHKLQVEGLLTKEEGLEVSVSEVRLLTTEAEAGGGGYFGGGGGGRNGSDPDYKYGGGGGGSGYIGGVTNASTKAGNTSFTSTSGGTETGHSGNGYARITLVEQIFEEKGTIRQHRFFFFCKIKNTLQKSVFLEFGYIIFRFSSYGLFVFLKFQCCIQGQLDHVVK